MGGRVGLEAARLLPGTVIGVIGVDTLHDADAKLGSDQAEAFLAGFENDFAATCDGFVRPMFGANADTVLIDQIAADMCAGPGPVGAALLRDYVAYDTAAAMHAAGVPVRSVNADRWPTNATANRQYCDFEVTILPGVGHFLMQEAPDQLIAALSDTVLDIVNSEEPGAEHPQP
jgi:pimeloyl-ACP methyl ester carboxylesterase